MNDQTDSQLLGAWAETRSEPAFAELVRRHVDFVHSAALRMVCDSHLAKDVAQSVFVALARDAARITECRVLAGWLHRTAQNIAAQTVRTDVRRRAREQEAATMNELLADSGSGAGVSPAWSDIAPHLDAALGELSEPDRDAVLLRYFENKSLREVGQALGTTDDTAQKRVSRAVERLREFFAKRGVTVGASGLVVVISANAVQAAPVGLAVTISTAVTLAGATISATATATATKAIAMTTLQKTFVTATVAVLTGAGIYEARQASIARADAETLRQQQAALTDQIEQLRRERDDATNRLASLANQSATLNKTPSELLKLRGEVARLRVDSNDPVGLAAKAWLAKVERLRQRLQQTPDAQIPEFRFLSDQNWLDVVKNYNLTDEREYRQAFSQLRSVAEGNVGRMLQAAMKEYSDANGGKIANDCSLLNNFLELPVEGFWILENAMLDRYVIYPGDSLQSLKLGGDWVITLKAPVDPEFDTRLAIGPNGMGSVNFNKAEPVDILAPAINAYAAANGGKMPNDPTQIAPYVNTPEQQAALQRAGEFFKAGGK